jgi:hypothetical protein
MRAITPYKTTNYSHKIFNANREVVWGVEFSSKFMNKYINSIEREIKCSSTKTEEKREKFL